MLPHPALQGLAPNGTSRLDAAKYITGGLWIDAADTLHYDGDAGRLVVSLLPEATTQPTIKPRSIIHHTQSGPKRTAWQNLIAYMRRTDIGLETHLIYELTGLIVQAMPFTRRASARGGGCSPAWPRSQSC